MADDDVLVVTSVFLSIFMWMGRRNLRNICGYECVNNVQEQIKMSSAFFVMHGPLRTLYNSVELLKLKEN